MSMETENKQTHVSWVYHTYVGPAGLNDCRCHQPMAHSVAHSLHEQNDRLREEEGRRGREEREEREGGGGREGEGRRGKEGGGREEEEGRRGEGRRGKEGAYPVHMGCL